MMAILLSGAVCAGFAAEVGHPTFLSPHAVPIVVSGGLVFAANTPADTVDVIDTTSLEIVARVHVGVDPVGIAVRPDGDEVWVTNHISDSVSVIDADPSSPTYLHVIATVQDLDPETRATRFDEPVGIVFAGNAKAYVTLSSENLVAVIDVGSREVTGHLDIDTQDPRALAVHEDRLYVLPFESNNQTQLSGCEGEPDGDLCTFTIQDFNNVLSDGLTVDVIKNPLVPDRDLYIFDTRTDELVEIVDTLGTLLYGITVGSDGRVFISQADARNDSNGRVGTRGDGLAEMENRAFLNQITELDCGGSCRAPSFIDLEPLPPLHPNVETALATPYGIQISEDDATVFVTAAGSDRLFAVDSGTGSVLGRVSVDAVPRGVALESFAGGEPKIAWVLNAAANTVSRVDVSDPMSLELLDTVVLDDPTHPDVKAGRIAFNTAAASSTGTFSCESCHPDGHTDHLLWVLQTPWPTGGTQTPPRITMPVRGLRDTFPLHWDGIPADPFGGINTANIFQFVDPNCDADDEESCTRQLVDGTLETTLCKVGDCGVNDEGLPGALDAAERDALARFLMSVPYPPSQRRSYDNVLSDTAVDGYEVFHIDGRLEDAGPNVCGDCHRMPFWVSTNTPFTGMDAPTWRGAYDRWLITPQGRFNMVDQLHPFLLANGVPEHFLWVGAETNDGEPNPFFAAWNMVTEGSTGFSGSFSRQITLNRSTATESLTGDLLGALEQSAAEGAVILQAEGVLLGRNSARSVALEYDSIARHEFTDEGPVTTWNNSGFYRNRDDPSESFTRSLLVRRARDGRFVGTFTARAGEAVDVDHPQPALWTDGPLHLQSGSQVFPKVSSDDLEMVVSGRHIRSGARLFVDGRRVGGSVRCVRGSLPDCEGERLVLELGSLPASAGIHLIQVQSPRGLFSNDFIFHVEP